MNYTEITSRKNKTVLDACALISEKKTRDKTGCFAIEGIKLLNEAIISGLDIKQVFFTQKALEEYGKTLEKLVNTDKFLVTDEVYSKLTEESAPQGVFAAISKPEAGRLTDNELKDGSFVMLEDIQNPLNIGAVLRCCFSLGFENVVFSSGCADIYSPKCARAAMGSLFKIKPFFTDKLAEAAKRATELGVRVFCTSLSEKSVKLGDFDFNRTDSFVIGNEGHGVSEEMLDACSHSLYIPMNEGAESLNAATAAGIVMWEIKKSVLCGE